VQGIIFGLKRDEIIGDWRKLHNEELHSFSAAKVIRVIKSRGMRWAWEKRSGYRVLAGKPKGKRPLGIPRYGWEDNIRMNLRETGLEEECGRDGFI
jgi:hypothetical protein